MLQTTTAPGPAPTIYLVGEMDLDCADLLREAVADAARGAEMVVLDFDRVGFIDSSGTGIFVRICLDMKSQGTPLLARRLSPPCAASSTCCACATSSAKRSSATDATGRPTQDSGPTAKRR